MPMRVSLDYALEILVMIIVMNSPRGLFEGVPNNFNCQRHATGHRGHHGQGCRRSGQYQ
jgi:hypothetical protein